VRSIHRYILAIVALGVLFLIRLIGFPPVFGVEDLELADKVSPYLLVVTATLFGFAGAIATYHLSYCDSKMESIRKEVVEITFKSIEYSGTEELKMRNKELLAVMEKSQKGLDEVMKNFEIRKSDFKESLRAVTIAFVFTILFEVGCLASLITDKIATPYLYNISGYLFLASFIGFILILYEV